jgi:transcription elongation factor Elf1
MKIKKEVEPIQHRQKCPACGYYTVYQAVPAGEKAIDACTYCGHQVEIVWDQDIKAVFRNSEKLFRDLEEICPELKELKKPGDHIRLD